MKYLIIVLLFAAFGCGSPCPEVKCPPVVDCRDSIITDTVRIIIIRNDSLQKTIDSLKTKLFTANYKIERVKYYIGIVNRNPSQVKFFRGWVTRAVE